MRTFRAAPRAAILIESMRDIGYSLETALADVIDNSLTAGARNIRLLAHTSGSEPRLGILDDGKGMDEATLLDALRLGSASPLDDRDSTDLGRFGLGLKTASFSQCRRVTVVSRQMGKLAVAFWDLDYVSETGDWLVQIPDDASQTPWADQLGETGTLVVWEKLDRLSERDVGDATSSQIVRRIDEAIEHLELVFHRFLSGEQGLKKVEMSINGRPLSAFDPFNSKHSKTIREPSDPELIRLGNHDIWLQAFTLPHHSSLTAAEWERHAGRAGYVKNQGFYVYRAKRLIISGTWFGLARQTELTKLSRVRIDIPNGLDADWKIDVKKASAQPPYQVRERLRRLIDTIGSTSKRVYTSRGRKLVSDSKLPVWIRRQENNQISYGLNPKHPVFSDFMGQLTEDLARKFARVIEMAGATLPLDAVFADISGDPAKVGGDVMSEEALEHAVSATFRQLSSAGIPTPEIMEIMRSNEPFRSNWPRSRQILDQTTEDVSEHE